MEARQGAQTVPMRATMDGDKRPDRIVQLACGGSRKCAESEEGRRRVQEAEERQNEWVAKRISEALAKAGY